MKKGKLITVEAVQVGANDDGARARAEVLAGLWRREKYSARIFHRTMRADGVRVRFYVVVVRDSPRRWTQVNR